MHPDQPCNLFLGLSDCRLSSAFFCLIGFGIALGKSRDTDLLLLLFSLFGSPPRIAPYFERLILQQVFDVAL